jgi:hypothetical protein
MIINFEYHEYGGITIIRNFIKYLLDYTLLHRGKNNVFSYSRENHESQNYVFVSANLRHFRF